MAKILWVHDDFGGPVNGLAEFNGQKVWFSRMEVPFIDDTTDDLSLKDRSYILTALSDDTLEMVEKDHIEYCEKTGAPLFHGDIRKIEKADLKEIIPKEEEGVEVDPRLLANVTVFNHTYDPNNISGTYLAFISEKEFENYLVPQRVEYIE